jgi:hypothetical protein
VAVTVNDTLPSEFTYINGTFYVDGVEVIPTVEKQEISYAIATEGEYTIDFGVKVTKAYWEVEEVCNEVVVNNASGKIGNATACFNVSAFEDLYKEVEDGPTEPVIEQKAEWTLKMGVTNNFSYTMNDTKITDRFGGDLMIDSINTTAGNYTFEYTDYTNKKANVTITNGTGIQIYSGLLNKSGVTIGDEPYEFHISWTGRTHKAHFAWTIGPLASGNSTEITINVSTDENPSGKQEYTSTDIHYLNSGATLKFIDEDMMQLSAVTAPIVVEAVLP